MTEIEIPTTSRSNTSEASISFASHPLVICLLVAVSAISIAVAFYSLARAEAALAQSEGARREARIMSYDVTYIRANLLARGINIPPSHEEAEHGSHHHPEYRVDTIASPER